MIEIELLNIMNKIIADGGNLEQFCKKLIYFIQKQHGVLYGFKNFEDNREKIVGAADDLVEYLRQQNMQKKA